MINFLRVHKSDATTMKNKILASVVEDEEEKLRANI